MLQPSVSHWAALSGSETGVGDAGAAQVEADEVTETADGLQAGVGDAGGPEVQPDDLVGEGLEDRDAGVADLVPCAGGVDLAAQEESDALARVEEKGVLRAAVYRDFAPYSYLKEGRYVGLDVDVAAVGRVEHHRPVLAEGGGDARVLENAGTARPCALDQRGTQVAGADAAIVGRPDGTDDIVDIHQRPSLPRFGGGNGDCFDTK